MMNHPDFYIQLKTIMKIFFFALLLATITQAQIVSPSKYSFEKLTWGDKFSKINNAFHITKFETSGNSFSPFSKKSNDIIQYMSIDTIQSERFQTVFQFHSEDSTLQSIMVAYYDVNSDKRKEGDVKANNMRILDILTKHYPSEYQERVVPLAGTIRVWSFNKTYVQAYILASMVSVMLTKQ